MGSITLTASATTEHRLIWQTTGNEEKYQPATSQKWNQINVLCIGTQYRQVSIFGFAKRAKTLFKEQWLFNTQVGTQIR